MLAGPRPRLVCLVYPACCDEPTLMNANGSISIIGAEQFLLVREHVGPYDVILYSDDLQIRDTDVLLVMTCIPLAPIQVLQKFGKVVYFFDDLTADKLNDNRYKEKMRYVSAIFHPIANIARDLRHALDIPAVFLPWSLARVPDEVAKKSAAVSVFLDLDDRNAYCARSISLGLQFLRSLDRYEKTVYAPEKYSDAFPEDARRDLVFVPVMPHDDFLKFLGKVWFYASGIPGSYEFAALEASFMGCGLISMKSALERAHAGGRHFLAIDFETDPLPAFGRLVDTFDSHVVTSEAQVRYPRDYPKRIPDLLKQIFEPAGGGVRE